MHLSRKRLLLSAGGITAVGAAATLVIGATLGLFSSSVASSPNTFATGTVSTATTATSTVCTITNMVPGDESANYVGTETGEAAETNPTTATCEFQVHYTGSVPAHIGLGAAFADTPSVSTLSGNLLWQITELTSAAGGPQTEPTQPGVYTTAGVINTNSAASPLFVANDTGSGGFYTFWVDYLLPAGVTSQTLTGPASLTLTVYAVQSGNNGTGATCSAGSQCGTGATGVPSWG